MAPTETHTKGPVGRPLCGGDGLSVPSGNSHINCVNCLLMEFASHTADEHPPFFDVPIELCGRCVAVVAHLHRVARTLSWDRLVTQPPLPETTEAVR